MFGAANISFLASVVVLSFGGFRFQNVFFGFHGFGLNFIMDVAFGLCYFAVASALCCPSLSYVVIISPMLMVFTLFLYCIALLFCKFRCFADAILLEDILEWCNVTIDGFVRGAFCMNCVCRFSLVVFFLSF